MIKEIGAGSFTHQYNTRDTFGMATKATLEKMNGVGCELRTVFKNGVRLVEDNLDAIRNRLWDNQNREDQ